MKRHTPRECTVEEFDAWAAAGDRFDPLLAMTARVEGVCSNSPQGAFAWIFVAAPEGTWQKFGVEQVSP